MHQTDGSRPGTTPAPGKLPLDRRAQTRRSSLSLPENLPLDNWKAIGEQIFVIADSSAWWLGDWLIYGQDKYPHRYREAIDGTSLDYQTLRNYAWIARKFPASRRRYGLSLQHHAEVAALSAAEQDLWLERAEREGWSRNELRRQLRTARRGEAAGGEETPGQEAGADQLADALEVTPSAEQYERWERAAERAESDLSGWIIERVDEAAASALRFPLT
ncbi:LmbU family transcriptional regulator [Streptomyces sp. NPDC057638]|uniref:LmbU family transcriptional regulator n=1 Tax=Streptomyces sp. NPDC057638 TaxID=3346190 RepID=UPI00368C21BA